MRASGGITTRRIRRAIARGLGSQRRAAVDRLDRRRFAAFDAADRAFPGRQGIPDPTGDTATPDLPDLWALAAGATSIPLPLLVEALTSEETATDPAAESPPPEPLVTLLVAPHGPTFAGVTPVAA